MSFADIEAELEKLTPDELRRLALKSWSAFVAKESGSQVSECSEDDPELLAALDDALEKAEARPERGHSATEVRTRLAKWISK